MKYNRIVVESVNFSKRVADAMEEYVNGTAILNLHGEIL